MHLQNVQFSYSDNVKLIIFILLACAVYININFNVNISYYLHNTTPNGKNGKTLESD